MGLTLLAGKQGSGTRKEASEPLPGCWFDIALSAACASPSCMTCMQRGGTDERMHVDWPVLLDFNWCCTFGLGHLSHLTTPDDYLHTYSTYLGNRRCFFSAIDQVQYLMICILLHLRLPSSQLSPPLPLHYLFVMLRPDPRDPGGQPGYLGILSKARQGCPNLDSLQVR